MASYSEVIEGLEILARYSPGGKDSHHVDAEHDVIYAGDDRSEVSVEDRRRLLELGWHFDREVDSWARFV